MLESTDVEDVAALDLVPSGESGDDFITSIPFQYFGGVTTEFSQNKLDELRDLWIKYVDE